MFGTPPQVRRALQPNNLMIPAQLPVNGINARDAYARMAPDDAVDLMNVLSNPYGLQVRNGYQEFATNIGANDTIGTMMSYYPATASITANPNLFRYDVMEPPPAPMLAASLGNVGGQIFACTSGQIFDVTAGGSGPWVAQINVAVANDLWSWCNFQNEAGAFLIACNYDGGYYIFGQVGFSDGFSNGFSVENVGFKKVLQGAISGQIFGTNPDNFVFVMAWKRRLWFIEKNTTRAWYLPVDQITGTVAPFDFGANFPHGGRLEVLINWTIDDGIGIDDNLIAISSEGDVVIYKGTDPNDAATFGLVGIWYVGSVPAGKRFAEMLGGDVHILSVNGLSQASQLIAMGQIANEVTENTGSKIDPLLRSLMQSSQKEEAWYCKFIPHEQIFAIGVPEVYSGQGVTQLAYKVRQKAWSRLENLPFFTIINHSGVVFGGGRLSASGVNGGGKVYLVFDNATDNQLLDSPQSGDMIRARVTPAFNSFGSAGMNKRFTMIRPTFVSAGNVSAKVTILTDFNRGTQFTAPTLPSSFGDVWNVGQWDVAKWSGVGLTRHKWLGVLGSGYTATCQIDAVALGGTVLTSIDWNVVAGGIL